MKFNLYIGKFGFVSIKLVIYKIKYFSYLNIFRKVWGRWLKHLNLWVKFELLAEYYSQLLDTQVSTYQRPYSKENSLPQNYEYLILKEKVCGRVFFSLVAFCFKHEKTFFCCAFRTVRYDTKVSSKWDSWMRKTLY